MTVTHRQSGKTLRLMQPQQFLATERTIVEDAYPGDIIGVFDNGTMGVGDTLYSGKKKSPSRTSRPSRRNSSPASAPKTR